MKTYKVRARILSLLMIIALVFPSISYAGEAIDKDETIYVKLDNKGKDIEKISSVWLHSNQALKNVEDKSILEEVINVKGKEKPNIKDGKITWQSDKKDIYYQGKTNKELPIKVEVTYYLDGKEVRPESIVGKSGQIKILVDIENTDQRTISLKNGEKTKGYAPYLVTTGVILPFDKFDNIQMNRGKLISDGSNQILSFISLPGLEESLDLGKDIIDLPNHLEIKADVVDFEMSPIVIAATSEIPEMEDLDLAKDLDELVDGIDSIVDAGGQLNDATGKLYDGQGELNSGIKQLLTGLDQIQGGTEPLLGGTLELKEGIDAAYQGSLELSQGANLLSQSANELGEGFLALAEATTEYSNNALEFSQGASQIAKGVESIPEGTKELNEAMGGLIAGTQGLQEGQDALSAGLETSIESLDQIQALAAAQGASDELKAALSGLQAGLIQAKDTSWTLSSSAKDINNGQGQIRGGLLALVEASSQLTNAAQQLHEGSLALGDGAESLNQNALEAKEGANKFSEGGVGLRQGINDLSKGLEDLSNGTNQLTSGISEFAAGSKELSQAGKMLEDGSQKLVVGSKELKEGMEEFYKEGIKKMGSEVNHSETNIKRTLEIKDELVKIAKTNKNFSGISEGMNGSLKFIMKTEGVKKEVTEEKTEIVVDMEEDKGFVNWLKGIF